MAQTRNRQLNAMSLYNISDLRITPHHKSKRANQSVAYETYNDIDARLLQLHKDIYTIKVKPEMPRSLAWFITFQLNSTNGVAKKIAGIYKSGSNWAAFDYDGFFDWLQQQILLLTELQTVTSPAFMLQYDPRLEVVTFRRVNEIKKHIYRVSSPSRKIDILKFIYGYQHTLMLKDETYIIYTGSVKETFSDILRHAFGQNDCTNVTYLKLLYNFLLRHDEYISEFPLAERLKLFQAAFSPTPSGIEARLILELFVQNGISIESNERLEQLRATLKHSYEQTDNLLSSMLNTEYKKPVTKEVTSDFLLPPSSMIFDKPIVPLQKLKEGESMSVKVRQK